jgi:hypothetical protein
MLHLAPATAGLSLLSQLVLGARGGLPLDNPLTYAASAALVVGALLAWGQDKPGQVLSFVVLAQTGLVVLAGTWGGEGAALALVAEGLVLLLSAGVLFLSWGYDPAQRLWSLPAAFAAAALVGLPFTLGFVGRSAMLAAFTAEGAWPLLVLSGFAHTLLFATLSRLVLRPAANPFPPSAVVRGLGAVGLAVLAAPLALLGSAPARLAELLGVPPASLLEVLARMPATGWVVWAAGLGLGAALWWREGGLHGVRGQLHPPLQTLFGLRWFYRAVAAIGEIAGRGVRGLALLLEGEGALLWVLVVLVLAWLYVQ